MAYQSRAKRFQEIVNSLQQIEGIKEDVVSEIQGLKEEMENWRDGLQGTNLEYSEKFNQLEECISVLENNESEIENIEVPDLEEPEFPGMY